MTSIIAIAMGLNRKNMGEYMEMTLLIAIRHGFETVMRVLT